MSMIELIPTLNDAGLDNLRKNAVRLQAGTPSPRQAEAEQLLPLIDAEVARRSEAAKAIRLAQKNLDAKPKAPRVAKAAATKAAPKASTKAKAKAAADAS